ncbi:MAG: sugar transferase [candidate division Zixibacteria bacterium]|nr:sugar transferase [candidate division Zixibacteria bacterium]
MAKRLFDVVVALTGLIVLSPLLIAIALAVKLSSPGPVFFRHERVGRNVRTFRVLKFRTMTAGSTGPPVTSRDDPRITPFGRVLRQTKLDEIPQLFNVLSGSMSLVGPRPEVKEFVEQFRDDYEEILTVRPGITDEASIHFRDEERILAEADDAQHAYVEDVLPKKIELAKHYVRNRSFLGDLAIIVRTLAKL